MIPGAVLGERFRLVEIAGRGGMGEIWRAADTTTGDEVAVKVALDRLGPSDRFAREAELLARVRHPALVTYLAHGTEAGRPWLAMKWIDGEPLHARIARAPLSLGEALAVARRIAGALGALHARGIVHRDVKPSNVMLPRGRAADAVLLDLGVARADAATRALTGTNLVIGTVGYMAPEQARSGRDVDARADVFSLGCVLFECLVGEPAYPGENPVAILASLLTQAPPPLRQLRPELPASLEQMLGRWVSHTRDQRPRDGDAALTELEGLGSVDALGVPPPRSAVRLSHAEQRLALAVILELGQGGPEAETVGTEQVMADLRRVTELGAAFGATVVPLGPCRALVLTRERGTIADRAAIAATVARAVVDAIPGSRIGIAGGSCVSSERLPAGDVLERAAALAARSADGSVTVDTLVSELLADRFELSAGKLGEPLGQASERRVLGRVVPFVGRDKDLAMLEAIVAEAIEEHAPRVALVLAAPGIGKSRLAAALASRLRGREDLRLVGAHAEAATAGATHAILRVAIRSAVALEPGSRDHARVRAYADRLAVEDRDRLADFLGELCGAPREDEPGPELVSARGDVELMARWTRRTVREWLAAECSNKPLVLVLEDLHWADEATLLHLGDALRALRKHPLVVIGFARPEVMGLMRDPWPDVSELRLGGLGARAAERLVRALLGAEADATVVERIVERAGGNPLFLEELARFVADGRGEDLPASVLAVLDARLAELDPELRWALRAASVLGERMNAAGTAAVAGTPVDHAASALSALVRAELLEREPEDHAYAFRHALVRDAAYATIPLADARAAHLRAADWLERSGRPSPHAMLHHLERAGERQRLVPWLTEAAWASSEAGADREAFRLAEQALALGASGIDEGRLALLSGFRANVGSDYVTAAKMSAVARARLPTAHREWLFAAGVGAWAAALRGNQEELRTIMTEWFAAKVQVTRGRLSYLAGYSALIPHCALGDRDGVANVLAAVVAPHRDDTAEAAWYAAMRAGHSFFCQGRMGLTIALANRGIEAATRSLDQLAISLNDQWVALAKETYVSSPRAITHVEAARERIEKLGFAHATEFVAQLVLLARAANDDGALEALAFQAHGGATPLRAAFAAAYYLSALLRRERPQEARDVLQRLRGRFPFGFARASQALCAARVELSFGRPREALDLLEAPDARSPASRLAWHSEWWSLVRIEALLALGDTAEARRTAQSATERYALSIEGADDESRAYVEAEVEPVVRLLALARDLDVASAPPAERSE